MNPVPAALLAAFAILASPAPSPATATALAEPGFAARTPAATVTRLADAYNHRSIDRMDALLTADYRFHFSEADAAGSNFTNGLSRENEMLATRRLFAFPPADTSIHRPQIDRMAISVGAVDEGVDPEHPDSTCQYRVVIAHEYRLRLVFTNGDSTTTKPALHVFHVVRGDAAVRMPGQPADTTHWYIRRWLEDMDAVTIALGSVDGECTGGPEAGQTAAVAPSLVGLRAIGVPLCSTLKVLCDLPGSEPALLEVYDVQGRRLAQRTLSPQTPGSELVEAGNGKRFLPGVYWVRLVQGRRPPVTRMVVVAR